MAQWGKAADTGGLRTTPETVQSVIGALYSNIADSPIISGGVVTGRADLAFDVSATVAAHKTPAGAVYVASDAVTTALITPPASGTQTWIVYMDADGQVNVGTSPVAPYVTIGQYNVPASCKATSSLTNTWNTNYALPFGANLGTLAWWPEKAPAGLMAASEYVATLQFYVPTDRIVSVDITQEIWYGPNFSFGSTDWTQVNTGACRWNLVLDGGAQSFTFELPFDQRRVLRQRVLPLAAISKGQHSLSVKRTKLGSLPAYHFGNTDGYDQGYYAIRDLGAAE